MATTLRDPAPAAPTRHFADDLRERSDEALVALLRARPDLATPSPSTLRSLAARASSRTSTERALARTDALTLQVLEAVLALSPARAVPEHRGAPPGAHAARPPAAVRVTPAVVARALGVSEDDASLFGEAVAHALESALLWDADPGAPLRATGVGHEPDLRTAPGLDEVLGPYPAGLGPDTETAATRALDAPGSQAGVPPLDEVPAGARAVLDALAWGPPVGVLPAPGSRARDAVDRLVRQGYLVRSDARHVMLPRAVGLALRGGHTHREPAARPPRPQGRSVARTTVDAESATAALEIVRRIAVLLATWTDAPAPLLRAGGLGVRDLRRVAAAMETDEASAAFVLELASTAGLVADDGEAPPSYVPTVSGVEWLDGALPGPDDAERWAVLVRAWAASRRTPWQIGTRDERGALRATLAPDLNRPWVPRLRAQVLEVLATAPDADGAAISLTTSAVSDVLAWSTPRAVPPERAVDGLLMEAAWLGVTGAGALSTAGRALLDEIGTSATAGADPAPEPRGAADRSAAERGAGARGTADPVVAALRAALPPEVEEVLLQGDLTGIVPGRPSRELARLLSRAADSESRGAATTVRFTAESVTRSLDHGTTADDLLAELARRSPVPLPQPLEYLVRDTARRHGAVRIGSAGSYLRAAEPTVLAGLENDPTLAHLGLVRLAPTVLAAAADAVELHEALRARGLVSALESPGGQVLDLRRARPGRAVPAPRSALVVGGRVAAAVSSAPDYAALVASLRAADVATRDTDNTASRARAEARDAARAAAGALLRDDTPEPAPAPAAGTPTPSAEAEPAEASQHPEPRYHLTDLGVHQGPQVSPGSGSTSARSGSAGSPPGFGDPSAGRGGAPTAAAGVGHDVTDAPDGEGTQHPADALAILRDAIRDGAHVWVELVGRTGSPERRRLRPLRLDGGRLRAVDPARDAELTVAVHRIAGVDPDRPGTPA
ncbi:helicase-associated domain-containing protein [Antribacter sp. KLBMP9083]|uniref:Helicase-associated domain-containing protein n=1 Tax=Antribacter soli TaxID=2910976 RepID=A0AA41U8A6_9MICO|nr:helicase-associated domain-containing protein [Antribacter soli]MCF4122220.1 helicase-associated domain-containing protein [Antribacter soli]